MAQQPEKTLIKGKSPSVKLMSRRENKELAKTNLKNMDRTMQELQHIGSIKDLRPKTCRGNFHEVRSAFSKFSDMN